MQFRTPVPQEHSRAFTEVAQGARLSWRVLATVGDPRPGSNFAQVSELYPFEKVSDWTHAYLSAAYEHLILWADYVAPFKFHPEQVTNFTLRPAYTLARAALESASQAVWLLSSRDSIECVRRHLCLVRWDFREHARSVADPEHKTRILEQDTRLLERVASVFSPDEVKPPRGYLKVIEWACETEESLDLTAVDAERIWCAASGSAHGKYWPNVDLQHVVPGEEYEPGQFRAFTLPNSAGMVEALEAAQKMAQIGVLRHADFCGADIPALMDEARTWLADRTPFKPDADPESIARLRHGPSGATEPGAR